MWLWRPGKLSQVNHKYESRPFVKGYPCDRISLPISRDFNAITHCCKCTWYPGDFIRLRGAIGLREKKIDELLKRRSGVKNCRRPIMQILREMCVSCFPFTLAVILILMLLWNFLESVTFLEQSSQELVEPFKPMSMISDTAGSMLCTRLISTMPNMFVCLFQLFCARILFFPFFLLRRHKPRSD